MAGLPLWRDDRPPGCRASHCGKASPHAPLCPRSHSTNAPSVQLPKNSQRIPEAWCSPACQNNQSGP
eukprot:8864559-Pyramimonas_sp.AAC.1